MAAAPRSGLFSRRVAARDGREVLLGGRQQLVALAPPFGGQQRIAAHDEPLAGELVAGDLGQVPLVEQ